TTSTTHGHAGVRHLRPRRGGGRAAARRLRRAEVVMSSQLPGDTEDLRDRSLGALLKQLSEQTTRPLPQELELARAELQQKGKEAGAGAGMFGGAGALGLAALGALTACFIHALNAGRPGWLGARVGGVVYGSG